MQVTLEMELILGKSEGDFSSLSKWVVGEMGSCNCCMCKKRGNGSFYCTWRCMIIEDPTNTISVNHLINFKADRDQDDIKHYVCSLSKLFTVLSHKGMVKGKQPLYYVWDLQCKLFVCLWQCECVQALQHAFTTMCSCTNVYCYNWYFESYWYYLFNH